MAVAINLSGIISQIACNSLRTEGLCFGVVFWSGTVSINIPLLFATCVSADQ